ncbi:MAG: FAD-dependent oxidoreductase [Arenicellales bacterium]
MASPARPLTETRREQMFPTLEPEEIARLKRFGEIHAFKAGERIMKSGKVSPGFMVLLSGRVKVSQSNDIGQNREIVSLDPGQFMGELAQLSRKPALVNIDALTDGQTLVISSPRLRDVLVQEAELGEIIMRALILRRVGLIESGVVGPVVVGHAGDRDVLRLENFLARNGHPHQLLDGETDTEAKALLERLRLAQSELPIVLCPNGQLLRNPSEEELARCIGLISTLDPDRLYDTAIVGAGPSGLGAAVYSASEGLSVLVLDCRAFGGQAGASARIENYLGFPTGIRGIALMARAFNQAQKFGAEMTIPQEVINLHSRDDANFELELRNGERVKARSVIVATGARYRRLDVPNLAQFEGSSVHYWASPLEGRLVAGQEVALVGGGNSAGQAAVYLASVASKVWLLCRGKGLAARMSRYLVERIESQPNIEVLTETEVITLEGAGEALESVTWRNRQGGAGTTQSIRHLFLFIGADPNTDWLQSCNVMLDAKGFVLTGESASKHHGALESSRAGVFAIGDVRAGSIKRVAAAVGEGAQVVAALHAFLAGKE